MLRNQLTKTEKLVYLFLLLIYIVAFYIDSFSPAYFDSHFAQEDGFVENLTALALLMIPILEIKRLIKFWRIKKVAWKFGVIAFIVLFTFGAGEEISWGQRIFEIETNEYFLENNAQGETNLHNLVVQDVKINKLIFSQLLGVLLFIYFVALPPLYNKFEFIHRLINRFSVPICKYHHLLFFLFFVGITLLLESNRKWELLELTFATIFFLIFLRPRNYIPIFSSVSSKKNIN